MLSCLMIGLMPSPRICRGRLPRRARFCPCSLRFTPFAPGSRAGFSIRPLPFTPIRPRRPTAVPAAGFSRAILCHPRSFCSLLRHSSIPAVSPPLRSSIAPISQLPPLCFQSLAHSSAIRWGWGCASPLATRHFLCRNRI